MPYQIYSVVINKCQCEIKLEDKMEKQINEKIIEMDREYPFLFCFKSDFWMEIPDDKVNHLKNKKDKRPQ